MEDKAMQIYSPPWKSVRTFVVTEDGAYCLLLLVNEGIYGESDRDKRSLPTVQHGRPQDQFVVTTALGSNANCPTREPLGINGIRVVMYLFYLFIKIQIDYCQLPEAPFSNAP